jgi:hypothetical protein
MVAEAIALCAALAAAAAGAGGLAPPSVDLEPRVLALGGGETARVVVRSASGAPRLLSSAGTLRAPVEVAPGVFEAVLEPPLESHPQLVLVAAIAPGGVGYAWLPLVGRGVAIAHTEPNAKVSVRIRDRTFGPSLANADGVAHVPVEVPPGERFAYDRGKPLDLRVPPLHQVHVAVDRSELRADRSETVTVYAFAATPYGAAWEGAPLALVATAGSLGPPRALGPGAIAAEWTLPPGAAGEAALEARLPGVPAARVEVNREAGPAARVVVRLGAARAAAGEAPVEVLVEISDAAGNRVEGEPSLRASFGALAEPVHAGRGLVRSSLRIPERLDSRREAVVEARLGDASDRRELALTPGPAASVEVKLEPPEVLADGRAASEVRVSVTDRFGNGVDEPAIALQSGHGLVGVLSRHGVGSYLASYAPGWIPGGGEDEVVVRAGTLVAQAPIRLLEPPRLLSGTVSAGVLHAFGGFTAPYVGAAIEAWPLRLEGRWGASLGLSRAASSRSEQAQAGAAPHAVEASSALWPLEATVLARRSFSPAVTGLAGLGVQAVRVHSTVGLDGERTADEWGWAHGLHVRAGAALELPAWRARLRVDAVLSRQGDTGMRSYRGALGTLGVTIGVSHDAL